MAESQQTSLQLPLVDISQPLLPSSLFSQASLVDISQPLPHSSLFSLSQAIKEWGFFHIINHGISKDLYTRLHTVCSRVFELPLDTKLKIGPSSSTNTYTPQFIASPFFESLRVSGPDYFASANSSSEALEMSNSEFCDILQEYGSRMVELSKKIMVLLLRCLGDGFDTKYYESEFSKCHGYLRINNYCPPDKMDLEEVEVEGLGMHTDMSCLTILYQDQTGGLQVRSKEGEWTDIAPSEDTLEVNIGDLFQAWSNGRIRSSEHRVVLKQPVRRFSLAFFWCFEDEKVISAPADVVEGKERIYRPFVCIDYVKFRENNEEGRFDKVGYTVDGFAAFTAPESECEASSSA